MQYRLLVIKLLYSCTTEGIFGQNCNLIRKEQNDKEHDKDSG